MKLNTFSKAHQFKRAAIAIALFGILTFALATNAQVNVSLSTFATGFSQPVDISATGEDNRLFIVERAGTIKVLLADGSVLGTPFLNIASQVKTTNGEQGLLGLVFHPDYANNGYFYVNYTDLAGDTTISRFSVTGNPDIGDPNSETILLVIDQPFASHSSDHLLT